MWFDQDAFLARIGGETWNPSATSAGAAAGYKLGTNPGTEGTISALNENFYIAKLVQRAAPKSVLTCHSLLPVLEANFSSLRTTGWRVLQQQRLARNTGGLNLD